MFKKLRFIAPLLIFSIIFLILWRGLSLHPASIPSPLVGQHAPPFLLPQLTTSQTTSEHDFLGHITLINVWATWCSACAEEHDFLMHLAHNENIFLYGLDYKDDPVAARQWLANRGNPYQIIANDQDGNVAIDFGVYGTPEAFLLDKRGMIRAKYIGAMTQEDWDTHVKPLVEKLRNES